MIEAGHGRSSFDDVVEALAQEFMGVPHEQLMSHINNCLSDLERKH